MPYYNVPIVEKSKLQLWHDFWDRKKSTPESVEANRDGSLGRTATVKARNKTEAAETAEAQNPGCVAIRDAIGRGLT